MKRLIPLLALLAFLPQRGSAETVLGAAIDKLPVTISRQGVYHFTKDLTFDTLSGIAVNIAANDVVIDLNAHVLVSTSGSNSTSTGIYCDKFNRVTVKNGSVRGFRFGVTLVSDGARVTDLIVGNNFGRGIGIAGNNVQILRNSVCNTGGAPSASFPSAVGISLTGTYGTVIDNDVQNTFATDLTTNYADGILLGGCSNVVLSNNRVLDVEPSVPTNGGVSTGIAADSTAPSDNLIFLNNIVVTTQTGFDLSGGSSGKYGDNTTSNISTGYNTTGSGMTDIGNNN